MYNWSLLSSTQQRQLLERPAIADSEKLKASVAQIIKKVKEDGDEALRQFTREFDRIELNSLQLDKSALLGTEKEIKPQTKRAIDLAFETISTFHTAQLPSAVVVETAPGVTCELQHCALDSVGLYVPGGTAPLPSTVLMLGIGALVAGCRRKVLCTPPGTDGKIAAEIRYAANKCGIDEVYSIGGAQAIAALALGTESVPPVDKIFGPGNRYVTEAKQQVSTLAGGPAIDMPAGPSEVLVIADKYAHPAFIAADLLSQAEHGIDAQSILLSDCPLLIQRTQAEVRQQLVHLSRQNITREAMENCRFILTSDLDQAVQISNRYAPEHLLIQTTAPRKLLKDVRNAGSVFIGKWSPESAGDYASGTNHVLPTYGYAKNYSSLGVADFMRRYTVQEVTQEGLGAIGQAIMELADAEGLDAHKQAVAIRMEQMNG